MSSEQILLDFAEKIDADLKNKKINIYTLELDFKSYKTKLDIFELDCRNDKTLNKNKRQHKIFYKEQLTRFKELQSEHNKKELLDGHAEVKTDDMETEDQLMKYGEKVQNATMDGLNRIQGVIEETKIIGIDIVTKTDQQLEDMAKIHDNLEDIESVMARSMKIIKRIGRKLATDKCVWVVLILIVIGIIALILFKYGVI